MHNLRTTALSTAAIYLTLSVSVLLPSFHSQERIGTKRHVRTAAEKGTGPARTAGR